MAKIPKHIAQAAIIPEFAQNLISQGKVRDTYQAPGEPNTLLILASDRISIFDFVLPALVPRKGEVLTALTYFWLTHVFKDVPNHLQQQFLNGKVRNRIHAFMTVESHLPWERMLAVDKLDILPYEMIYRAHIGGSVWKQYQKDSTVAGVKLRPGLTKWQHLSEPLFTPSTKADNGHDVNITQDKYYEETGTVGSEAESLAKLAFTQAYQHALQRHIVILDTKLEVGLLDGKPLIGDEVVTPDSSRFTPTDELEKALAEHRDPPFYDKEPVREWGRTVETPFYDEGNKLIVGINNLDPANEEHVAFVHSLTVPQEVIGQCTARYLDICKNLVLMELDDYQQQNLL